MVLEKNSFLPYIDGWWTQGGKAYKFKASPFYFYSNNNHLLHSQFTSISLKGVLVSFTSLCLFVRE